MKRQYALTLAAALVAAAGAAQSGTAQSTTAGSSAAQPAEPPAGPGLTIVNEKCGSCHTTSQVFATRRPAAEWPAVVQQMIDRGAELSPEEQETVSTYLAAHYASDGGAAKASTPAAAAAH